MKLKPVLLAAALMVALPVMAQSQLTVVNFGGANGAAQKKAYFEAYEKAGGGKITAVEYNGEQAKIKAMVEAKKVTWDVVEVESPDLSRGCDEGLFEKMDWAKVGNKADFQKAAVHECGVGTFVWSTVMAYDGDKLKTAPTTWADFWDVKKFPGKRGMRKGARYNLEFALMADGVKTADVYKVLATKDGADRAFKKLTELKPNIQWWEAGAQPPQFLVAGDVAMTTAYNGRIDAAQREGKNLKITWTGGIYDLDYWVMPKGTPNKDAALKFIAMASSPDAQAEYAKNISYGPTNNKALTKLDAKVLNLLPTSAANSKTALQFIDAGGLDVEADRALLAHPGKDLADLVHHLGADTVAGYQGGGNFLRTHSGSPVMVMHRRTSAPGWRSVRKCGKAEARNLPRQGLAARTGRPHVHAGVTGSMARHTVAPPLALSISASTRSCSERSASLACTRRNAPETRVGAALRTAAASGSRSMIRLS